MQEVHEKTANELAAIEEQLKIMNISLSFLVWLQVSNANIRKDQLNPAYDDYKQTIKALGFSIPKVPDQQKDQIRSA